MELNGHDYAVLSRLLHDAHRRAVKAAEKNAERGIVPPPGHDANLIKQRDYARLIEKLERERDAHLPESFLASPGEPPARSALVDAAVVTAIEDERDAAEALADARGAMLAEVLPLVSDPAAVERVAEHLRVTGES